MSALLLHNAEYVLSLDAQRRVWRNASLMIEGDRIAAIGPATELLKHYRNQVPPQSIRDCSGTLLAPGFVNAHAHTMEHLSRGLIPDDLATLPWVLGYFFPFQAALNEDEAYVSAALCCLDMIKHGTTCFIDSSVLNSNAHLDAVKQAIEDSGLRAIIGRGVCDRTPADIPDSFKAHWHENVFSTSTAHALGEVRQLMTQHADSSSGRVRVWPTLFGLFSLCSDDLFTGVKKLADQYGTGTNFHVASSIEEATALRDRSGRWPISQLDALGALGDNVLLTHAVMVEDAEVDLLAERGTKIAHCPGAALRLAKGAARHGKMPEMLAAGIPVAIGADGVCSCGTFDHVRLTGLAAGLFKDARMDASLIPAETALEMATLNGAKALLWDDEIGSLSVGKKADLVQFDLNRPEWVPCHDPVRTLVYSADGASAVSVIVDGVEVLASHRATRMDEAALLSSAREAGARVVSRLGVEVPHRWPHVCAGSS